MYIYFYIKKILITTILLFNTLQVIAQDLHFSQYYNAPIYVNPASVGVFNGDYRFVANYRSQWNSVPVPYTTFSGSIDTKLLGQKLKNDVLGLGFILNYDKAGDAELSLFQIGLSLAYTKQLNQYHFFTVGFNYTASQRSFDFSNLTFDSQYNGDIFDESLSTRENFDQTSYFYSDFSAGINYHFTQKEKKGGGYSYGDVGIGIFHLNHPRQNFLEDNIKLPLKLMLSTNIFININPQFDIVVRGIGMLQNEYQEGLIGLGSKLHFSRQRSNERALGIYAYYRVNDALIPSIEIDYKAWRLGLSYDINISNFNVATNNRGGLEASLNYVITTVKPLEEQKNCPIF